MITMGSRGKNLQGGRGWEDEKMEMKEEVDNWNGWDGNWLGGSKGKERKMKEKEASKNW